MVINGKEVPARSGDTIEVEDPATGAILTTVPAGDAADVDDAVAAARAAFDSGVWSRADVRERADVMAACAQALAERVPEIAELESIQTGRAIREMRAQLGRLPEWLHYFGALARTSEGSVPPFKGPYINYVCPALAAGGCVRCACLCLTPRSVPVLMLPASCNACRWVWWGKSRRGTTRC